jgi:PBSX family phage terminase large subunit
MFNIKLLPKQWEVFNAVPGVDFDMTLYQGGVGSGKTFLGGLKGLSILSQNHGATWLVGADTYARLKISTCETYEELLDEAKIRYKHNKSDHTIRIPGWDDARVLFKGLEDPHALRSVNGIGGHLEEASLLNENAFLEFLGRLRQAKPGDPISVILTTNPQTMRGWLHEHFGINAGVAIQTVRGKEVKVSRRRVIASTLENKHVSDAFIASLQASYDEDMYKIMVEGQDGDYTSGLVVKGWSYINEVETEWQPDQRIHITCDFNVDPMCWGFAHTYGDKPGQIEYHFFDELAEEYATTRECIDKFALRYPPNKVKAIEINGDSSGNQHRTEAQKYNHTNYNIMLTRLSELGYGEVKLKVRSANPLIIDRVTAFNAAVSNSEGVHRVFVNPKKCKYILYNMNNLMWKEGDQEIAKPTPTQIKNNPKSKFLGHPFDAVSYLVELNEPVKRRTENKQKGKNIRPNLGFRV